MIKTFEEACEFVLKHKICTVFGSKNSPYPSLWDNTDLSTEKPAEGGWSPRVRAVWAWKTKIPQTFPDDFFYGKVPGGDAVISPMTGQVKVVSVAVGDEAVDRDAHRVDQHVAQASGSSISGRTSWAHRQATARDGNCASFCGPKR